MRDFVKILRERNVRCKERGAGFGVFKVGIGMHRACRCRATFYFLNGVDHPNEAGCRTLYVKSMDCLSLHFHHHNIFRVHPLSNRTRCTCCSHADVILSNGCLPICTVTHCPGIGMQPPPNQVPRGRETPPPLGSDLISGIDIQSTKGGCLMRQFPLVISPLLESPQYFQCNYQQV